MATRLRWLASLLAGFAAGIAAQQLDLRLPKDATEGVVAAFRQLSTGSETALVPRSGPRQVGTQSSLDQGPLVGAVVYMTTGPASPDTWNFGAVGTPEMQPWLSDGALEVVVTMDDGQSRTFRPRNPQRFRPGQRVTVRSGELEPLDGRRGGG